MGLDGAINIADGRETILNSETKSPTFARSFAKA